MEQAKLPTKTKIAAWWLIVLGAMVLVLFGWLAVDTMPRFEDEVAFVVLFPFLIIIGVVSILISISFIRIGKSLLRRDRRSWKYGVIFTFIIFILGILILIMKPDMGFYSYYYPLFSLAVLPPLILLLIDRKNFVP